jgi:hypothetical protein
VSPNERAEYVGATVVAYYGTKQPELHDWLANLQESVSRNLNCFKPRAIEQVHATLVGLEIRNRGTALIDTKEVLRYLSDSLYEGVTVRFGGYAEGVTSFRSRGREPYERSFVVSGAQCVIVGWPVEINKDSVVPNSTIANIRHGVERYGFQHRYHRTLTDSDPDLYSVIGELAGSEESSVDLFAKSNILRQYMVENPLVIDLNFANLSVVQYVDVSLDGRTSKSIPLADALNDKSVELIDATINRF